MANIDPQTLTHCYYFASPTILPTNCATLAKDVFMDYSRYYVYSFERLASILLEKGRGNLTFFFPSTKFIDHPQKGFAEYAAAKAAGEDICGKLASQYASSRFIWRRLPRLRTDQTAGLMPVEVADPIEVPKKEILTVDTFMSRRQ